jgi:hypothetical protein
MSEKKGLTDMELQHYAELVRAYLNPSERFEINGKGEVSLTIRSWFARVFKRNSEDHFDFLEVVQIIVKKIMDEKGVIPFIDNTCDGALGSLLESNDRSFVIKELYKAYIVDEDPQIQEAKVIGQEITLESKQRMLPPYGDIFERDIDSEREMKKNLCEILNEGNGRTKVVVIDKRV